MEKPSKLLFINLFTVLILINSSIAQSLKVSQSLFSSQKWGFLPNKGQLADAQGNILTDIKYYGHRGNTRLYCRPGRLSFVFTKTVAGDFNISEAGGTMPDHFGTSGKYALDKAMQLHQNNKQYSTRADMVLLGANLDANIIASEVQQYYENYFLAHTPVGGITNVHSANTLTYQNIYPHIDMVLHATAQGMKYEFVVYPGGKVSDIRMHWDGLADMQMTASAGIRYTMHLHDDNIAMEENAPVSSQGGQKISSAFNRNGKTVGFTIGNYDSRQTLVIDPSIIWSTYYGGTNDEYANAIATDASGNSYITGTTLSYNGIASSGAYQTSRTGDNAFLAKFSATGSLIWATYYGGNYYDEAFGVNIDISGNVLITGYTSSTSGIATKGAYQTSMIGGFDAFLAKFSTSGGLTWATYYGGYNNEYGRRVSSDASGNVYITGYTKSSNAIATSGTYQTTIAGGYDAFLAKFTSSGKISWATYFGGSNDDYAESVCTDASGNVFITGSSTSNGIATSGAYQTSFQGSTKSPFDAFLAKFTSAGILTWATYYGGTGNESGGAIKADASGNLFVAGSTLSTSGIATSGAYKTNISKANDVFLSKFSNSGSLIWGTYYGGDSTEFANDLCLDRAGNIYITGMTLSKNGIATYGSYQTSGGGKYYDAFLAAFNSSGYLNWASYFGGANDDYGYGISTDTSSNVYITGLTLGSNTLATNGAYQYYSGGSDDAFLAKFYLKLFQNDAGLDNIKMTSGSFCAGVQPVKVRLVNYGTQTLSSVKIGWSINRKLQSPYSWTGKLSSDSTTIISLGNASFTAGIDTIKAWTSKPNGLIDSLMDNDTAHIIDTVKVLPHDYAGNPRSICAGDSTGLGGNPTIDHIYKWYSKPTGFNSTKYYPWAKPSVTTQFYVLETIIATGCTNTDSVLVTVNPSPKPNAGRDTFICSGATLTIGQKAINGDLYKWTSLPSMDTLTSAIINVSPALSTSYILAETIPNNNGGCTRNDTVNIKVNPSPKAYTGLSKTICKGGSISLGDSTRKGHTYSWSDNFNGHFSNSGTPTVSPAVTTTYTLIETIPATGCSKTNSGMVIIDAGPNVKFIASGHGPNKTILFYPVDSSLNDTTYHWDFGDKNTGSGRHITHAYKAYGNYQVSLRATSIIGCSNEYDSTVIVDLQSIAPTSQTDLYNINIYPNPFRDKTIIHFNNPQAAQVKISISDMLGKVLYTSATKQYSAGDNTIEINAEEAGLSAGGTYFVSILIDEDMLVRKLVVTGR